MQIAKSQSEILTERGMWISAEKYTDVRLLSVQKDNNIKVFLSCYTFSSAQYKVLPRRMSFSLASQVPHYNSPYQRRLCPCVDTEHMSGEE